MIGALAACAGGESAQKQCPSDAWVGKCELRDVRKVEERELPMPYVVYEATYHAQKSAEYPRFTPADVRMRFGAPAKYEFALLDHLKPQALVTCHAASIPGSCQPQEAVADVTPFDPEHLPEATAPRVTGCSAIDSASEQERLAKSRIEAGVVSERFDFAADSSALAPEASDVARTVAKRLADETGIECLGLLGQTSPGESASLAEARARAVKQLLISLGVDGKRLLTIAATAKVYGPSSERKTPDADSRRVSLSILLKTESKPSP